MSHRSCRYLRTKSRSFLLQKLDLLSGHCFKIVWTFIRFLYLSIILTNLGCKFFNLVVLCLQFIDTVWSIHDRNNLRNVLPKIFVLRDKFVANKLQHSRFLVCSFKTSHRLEHLELVSSLAVAAIEDSSNSYDHTQNVQEVFV
jgi:hypothetical protein